ncbi:MAG: hydroxyacylglutathione hydrolase [Legionella sp.]|nr:hydroxyacylglutathione hydrolase [Legionella sp.]
MNIYPIKAFTDNYIWLLVADDNKSAICVDPGDAAPVIHFLKENDLTLETVLLTHHHADHINGVSALLAYDPLLEVYGPNDVRITAAPRLIANQSDFTLHAWQFHVLQTPGHTSSHICFYESNYGLLFCGDTLFSAGCGRIFDGSIEMLYSSLNTLKELPDETRVYCGHEYTRQNLRFAATVEPHNSVIQNYYQKLTSEPALCSLPSTIALEKEINPFLRLTQEEVKQYVTRRGSNTDPLSVLKQLRDDKNNFS